MEAMEIDTGHAADGPNGEELEAILLKMAFADDDAKLAKVVLWLHTGDVPYREDIHAGFAVAIIPFSFPDHLRTDS